MENQCPAPFLSINTWGSGFNVLPLCHTPGPSLSEDQAMLFLQFGCIYQHVFICEYQKFPPKLAEAFKKTFLTIELKKTCDRAGFGWDSISTPVVFLWSSQSPLPTRVCPVLRLTFLQKTRWLPALTGPTCCPVHKHGKTASKSLALRTKVLSFPNVPTLEPIMVPQTNFVATS